MTVHNLSSGEQFKEAIAKHPVVLLDAFATWCGPCKAIAPQIATMSEDPRFKDLIYFAKFDVDGLPDLAKELDVHAMPTFYIFKDGKQVEQFVGANPSAILNLLTKHTAEESETAEKDE